MDRAATQAGRQRRMAAMPQNDMALQLGASKVARTCRNAKNAAIPYARDDVVPRSRVGQRNQCRAPKPASDQGWPGFSVSPYGSFPPSRGGSFPGRSRHHADLIGLVGLAPGESGVTRYRSSMMASPFHGAIALTRLLRAEATALCVSDRVRLLAQSAG